MALCFGGWTGSFFSFEPSEKLVRHNEKTLIGRDGDCSHNTVLVPTQNYMKHKPAWGCLWKCHLQGAKQMIKRNGQRRKSEQNCLSLQRVKWPCQGEGKRLSLAKEDARSQRFWEGQGEHKTSLVGVDQDSGSSALETDAFAKRCQSKQPNLIECPKFLVFLYMEVPFSHHC